MGQGAASGASGERKSAVYHTGEDGLKLPDPWVRKESKAMRGVYYYWNPDTCEASWTQPGTVNNDAVRSPRSSGAELEDKRSRANTNERLSRTTVYTAVTTEEASVFTFVNGAADPSHDGEDDDTGEPVKAEGSPDAMKKLDPSVRNMAGARRAASSKDLSQQSKPNSCKPAVVGKSACAASIPGDGSKAGPTCGTAPGECAESKWPPDDAKARHDAGVSVSQTQAVPWKDERLEPGFVVDDEIRLVVDDGPQDRTCFCGVVCPRQATK